MNEVWFENISLQMEHLLKEWNCILRKREAEVVMHNKDLSFQLCLCIAE